jgi:uncharacterized RmlC-like cupin family protein
MFDIEGVGHHPQASETFTVVRGRIGTLVDGRRSMLGPGSRLYVPPGTPHYWWNVADETSWVIVEFDRDGDRFDKLTRNLYFLAADGKADRNGLPKLLPLSLLVK